MLFFLFLLQQMSPPKSSMVYFKVDPSVAHQRNKIRDSKNPYDLSYLQELAGIYDTIVECSDYSDTIESHTLTTVINESGKRVLSPESLDMVINRITETCKRSNSEKEFDDEEVCQSGLHSCEQRIEEHSQEEPHTPISSPSTLSPPLSLSPYEKR